MKKCKTNSDCPRMHFCDEELCHKKQIEHCQHSADCKEPKNCFHGKCVCPFGFDAINNTCVLISSCKTPDDCPMNQNCTNYICSCDIGLTRDKFGVCRVQVNGFVKELCEHVSDC